jgi:RHS repeat-associated protein
MANARTAAVATMSCLILLGAAGQQPGLVPADAATYLPAAPPQLKSVPVQRVGVSSPAADPSAARALHAPPAPPGWPAAAASTVDLGAMKAGASPARAGGLPVWVGPAANSGAGPARVRVEVLDRDTTAKSGYRGVLLRVSPPDGQEPVAGRLAVQVDYAGFQFAYGADWATRLRLLALPDCALSQPNSAACQGAPIPSRNDVPAQRLSADVTVPASASGGLFAVAAAPSGPAGDFSATPLAASSTWQAGGSTGDFTWSYPMRVPPSLGGPLPQLALSYSAGSVDGRTAASNNQPSWIGEGFELWPGYVERRYKACADDMGGTANNAVKTGDECWATDNAFLSLGGKATELIRDDATGVWHPRSDDGSRIEHLTGAANGDDNGEWWKVTTANGTQYWFGRNQLPGWGSGNPVTNATWTVPVYGNNTGEPCHAASFDASWCQQAWRWNLDYVVDPHGNSMSLWYGTENNSYGRNLDPAKATGYTRGGWLSRIDYGTRTEAEFGTAPARVVLDVADRCIPDAPCDTAHPTSWPDVPWDENCTGAPCTNQLSPTFWTTKRLSKVTTQVWGDAGKAYRAVDSWTLRHDFLNPGDGTRAGLWLAGVTHTGLVSGTATLPEVTFTGTQLNNRVDGLDHSPPMNWWRIAAIHTETGGEISVRYSDRDCIPGSRMPASPDSNTLRCFPVYWTPAGFTQPTLDWFHKYTVAAVSETDLTGGSPLVGTTYEYVGTPAWRYDDADGLVPASRKSWSQWRGYERVRVYRGDSGERTETETQFFRGMDGDRLATGGRRSVSVVDSDNVSIVDADALAGTPHEEIAYNGPGGAVVSATSTDPWLSDPTATRTINGDTVSARHLGTKTSRTKVALDGGRGWRRTQTVNDYDTYGMVTSTDDQGDVSTHSDDRCLRYTYARNTDSWLTSYQSRVETYALSCAGKPTTADDVIGDARSSFDGKEWGVAPTVGDVTTAEKLADWTPTNVRYVMSSTSKFDAYGRVTDTWDVDGGHTTTGYTPASGGPVTSTTTTNPLGHTATATLEPAWGRTSATVDANSKRTDLAFDPFGRLTAVWLPGRTKGTDTATTKYSYLLRTNGTVAVTTQTLNSDGGYVTSYTLYDGLLRPRQTQGPALDGAPGRVLTDTLYDTAGRQVTEYGKYFNDGAPGTDLVAPVDFTQVPTQTRTSYDGAGRVVASVFAPGGQERWRTTTAYAGDRVDVTPPAGGTATSTLTDARDNTVELRQYHNPTPTGGYDATRYGYDRKGRLASVTDPVGNKWTYGYDIRGRQIQVIDPDKGTTNSTYDDADQLTFRTDSRNRTLAYSYDALGRRTAVYDGSTTGTLRAKWTYDTLAKGYPTSSTRYFNGSAYVSAVRGYTDHYDSTGTVVTIPAVEGALAGTYTFRDTYSTADNSLQTQVLPAVGDLPKETLQYGYDTLGQPSTLTALLGSGTPGSYVTETSYSKIGQLLRYVMANGGPKVWRTFTYDNGTSRLRQSFTDREAQTPNTLEQATYDYDAYGNLLRSADAPPSATADTQCFNYDYLQRLTQAWTPGGGDCSANVSTSALAGPAPYWQSWSYDLVGDRTGQVSHATSAGEVTTTYTYPQPGQAQPHTVRSATVTDKTGTRSRAYDYDLAGDTTSRPGQAATQTLTWDNEGELASVGEGSGTTSYVYGADGSRLIRRDATGATLYLPGTELRLTSSTGQTTATRYYEYGGQTVAMRTAAGVSWLSADHHGTPELAINSTDQSAVQRRLTPFGEARGADATLPTEKGFVGGPVDPTGLTHLGAREYDPALGRFISVDPIIDNNDPQQLNGYAYANNNPTTRSDPTGLVALCECGAGGGGGGSAASAPAPNRTQSSGGSGGLGGLTNQAWNQTNKLLSKAVNAVETHKSALVGHLTLKLSLPAVPVADTGGIRVAPIVIGGKAKNDPISTFLNGLSERLKPKKPKEPEEPGQLRIQADPRLLLHMMMDGPTITLPKPQKVSIPPPGYISLGMSFNLPFQQSLTFGLTVTRTGDVYGSSNIQYVPFGKNWGMATGSPDGIPSLTLRAGWMDPSLTPEQVAKAQDGDSLAGDATIGMLGGFGPSVGVNQNLNDDGSVHQTDFAGEVGIGFGEGGSLARTTATRLGGVGHYLW